MSDTEILFRSHRGGYAESMATVVPVASLNDIARHLELTEVQLLVCEFVTHDPRNNWNTHAITYNGACIGHSNAMLGFETVKIDTASLDATALTRILSGSGMDVLVTNSMLFAGADSEKLGQALKNAGVESQVISVHVIGKMFVVPADGAGSDFVPEFLRITGKNKSRKGRR